MVIFKLESFLDCKEEGGEEGEKDQKLLTTVCSQ